MHDKLMQSTTQHKRHQYGAALVESALALIYLLGLVFAGVQLGLIGYYQLALDQGSATQARMTALGNTSASTNTSLDSNLPNLQNTNLNSPTLFNPPQIDTQNVNYNMSNENARTGGYTFTTPLQNVSSTTTNAGFLQIGLLPVSLNSSAIEASFAEFCPHYCLVPGGLTSATAQNDSINYFTKGDNSTPYYIGFHYMETCLTDPDVNLSNPLSNPVWDSCPQGGIYWRALGNAAHLDSRNDFYTLPGVQLSSSYTGIPLLPPTATQAGPFFETWCHRNVYMWIDINALQPFDGQGIPNASQFLPLWLGFNADGSPKPGQMIYGASGNGQGVGGNHLGPVVAGRSSPPGASDQTGSAGWDSTSISENSDGSLNYSTTLSPWWGCGVSL